MEQRGFVFQPENLLSPGDALAAFFARARLPQPRLEFVAIDDAFGRVLADSIAADADYPQAPRSAMDGFAVRAAETPGMLTVTGEIAMGAAWDGALGPRSALRIPTGGVVPAACDAVVPIEDARLDGASLRVHSPVTPGENVTPAGSDMRRDDAVLRAGVRIGAAQAGVLATLGVTAVPVYRRPVVAIVSSGDELVDPGEAPAPGQIRDSNRYAVAGALRAMGLEPRHRPTVGDGEGELESALRQALETADAAVVTGGSSVGERDRTPAAIAALGAPGVLVHGLKVKPGKPTVFAMSGEKPVIGLPGNPASALTILQAVAAPIFGALAGASLPACTVSAVLASAIETRPGWTWYVPVRLGNDADGCTAHPLPLRSSAVSLAARAGGYIVAGEHLSTLPAGSNVDVFRYL